MAFRRKCPRRVHISNVRKLSELRAGDISMRDFASMAVICLLIYPLLPLEKNCTSASDGCRVCKIAEGRVIGCSFPGIACTRGDWQCNEWSMDKPSQEVPEPHPPSDNR